MRQIAEGDRRDAAEASARKLKASVIAVQQKNQLSEFRENYLERLRTEKRDGELIQKKAANDLVEDARVKEEAQARADQAIGAIGAWVRDRFGRGGTLGPQIVF